MYSQNGQQNIFVPSKISTILINYKIDQWKNNILSSNKIENEKGYILYMFTSYIIIPYIKIHIIIYFLTYIFI